MEQNQNKLTIVSACFYDNEQPAFRLIESCRQNGLNLSLYGIKQFGDNWRNMKVVKLLEHLETITTEYVLYTDAGDSWMCANEGQILRNFKRHSQSEILISGERSMYPFFECNYPKSPLGDTDQAVRFICAGGFMGKTENVKQALKYLLELPEDGNDQLLWHQLFLSNKMDIAIDYYCNVFLSMSGLKLSEIELFKPENWIIRLNKRQGSFSGPFVTLKKSNNISCCIHFNGGKGGSPNEQNMLAAWEGWKQLCEKIKTITEANPQ